jgi:hypothetical protein
MKLSGMGFQAVERKDWCSREAVTNAWFLPLGGACGNRLGALLTDTCLTANALPLNE